jgi:hypothetical protein
VGGREEGREIRSRRCEANQGQPWVEEAEVGGGMCQGNNPTLLTPPPSLPILFHTRSKNSPFRDKISLDQDVDLHGVVKMGDQKLVIGKEMKHSQRRQIPRSVRGGELKD